MNEAQRNLIVFLVIIVFLSLTLTGLSMQYQSLDDQEENQQDLDTTPSISISGELETNENVVYQSIKPSLVTIYASKYKDSEELPDDDNNSHEEDNDIDGVSQGSGFVYSNSYVVTNYHVLDIVIEEENTEIYVRFYDGEWAEVEIKGHDKNTDLAVLELQETNNYPNLEIKGDELPHVGDRVLAAGSPRGYEESITTGIISGTERTMRATASQYSIPDTIQTDVSLSQGNSGGPLVNMDGEVVGVNRAVDGNNIGLAISGRITESIVQSLINTGDHRHPFIGISTVEFNPAHPMYDITEVDEGIMVVDVMEGSPAENVLEGENEDHIGDIITHIDGHEVRDNEDLSSYLLRNKKPEDDLEMSIIRDGEQKNVTITLGERP